MHVEPAAGEKVPIGHAVQLDSDVDPTGEDLPATHKLHDFDPVVEE